MARLFLGQEGDEEARQRLKIVQVRAVGILLYEFYGYFFGICLGFCRSSQGFVEFVRRNLQEFIGFCDISQNLVGIADWQGYSSCRRATRRPGGASRSCRYGRSGGDFPGILFEVFHISFFSDFIGFYTIL